MISKSVNKKGENGKDLRHGTLLAAAGDRYDPDQLQIKTPKSEVASIYRAASGGQ